MDADLRHRLATLVVQALEVGARKNEGDVIDDLFTAFAIDVEELNATFRGDIAGLREESARRLAAAAPTAAALLNEVVRCGGRFVAMVNEVYARLARHAATTDGTSETFRLERRDVAEEHLTVSRAFVEQLRRLTERIDSISVGPIDEDAITSFVLWDNGELFGRWPVGDREGIALPDAVLHLHWIGPAAVDRSVVPGTLVESAVAAADRLADASERVLRSYVTRLSDLDEADAVEAASLLFQGEFPESRLRYLDREMRYFRETGVLGAHAERDFVSGVATGSVIGMRNGWQPVARLDSEYHAGTGLSSLAGFVAMWRRRLWASRKRPALEPMLDDPRRLADWLERTAAACDEAATWLVGSVFRETDRVEVRALVEIVEEFLNLPLWRRRDLLYEVWVLSATLDAAERADWVADLNILAGTGGVWRLTLGPTGDPVARLRRAGNPELSLDVWHEPKRVTSSGLVTPDVTVSTAGPQPRDLLVVEAKDRHRMDAEAPRGERRTALAVARRYAEALHPVATWVCNHCDFHAEVDPSANRGDPWTRIHLAARFRPGSVPDSFRETVELSLRPAEPIRSGGEPGVRRAVTFVIDRTASMEAQRYFVWELFAASGDWTPVQEFRAVLYNDHGEPEPYLVRKLGPFADLASVAEAAKAERSGEGGDTPEALEDALQRCRELVADVGPHTIVVITDAPPHTVDECPYGIDFAEEVDALLAAGCRIYVATDWLENDTSWAQFEAAAGFARLRLWDVVDAVRKAPATPAGRG